jgi:hypothetical protein
LLGKRWQPIEHATVALKLADLKPVKPVVQTFGSVGEVVLGGWLRSCLTAEVGDDVEPDKEDGGTPVAATG